MSQNVTISDIAALVSSGELKEAKRQARALIDTADPRHLELVARCAEITETYPRTAVTRLRWLWHQVDAEGRAIIEACAPADGEDRSRPQASDQREQRAPRWNARNRYQTPRDRNPNDEHPSRSPRRRAQIRAQLRKPRPAQRPAREPAVSLRYQESRAGMDDQPQRAERPAGYANDYDKAAVPARRGTACVSCWIERAAADMRHPDDGLCGECRDAGRRGIAPLPNGSRAEAIAARCAYIAANHLPATARVLLRADWHSSPQREQAVIAAWVKAHPIADTTQPADDTAAPLTPCATCTEPRGPRDLRHQQADDGQCAQCRAAAPAETDEDAADARELAAVA
jgi:hypothetical protein